MKTISHYLYCEDRLTLVILTFDALSCSSFFDLSLRNCCDADQRPHVQGKLLFRCVLNTHTCTALCLIFWRAVLLVLLKHSHSNSHDLIDLSVSQTKALNWILFSRPAVPETQTTAQMNKWDSGYLQQFHLYSLYLSAELFLMLPRVSPLWHTKHFKSCLAVTRKRFLPSSSISVGFSFCYWNSGFSDLVVLQLSTKIKAETVLVFVSLKHQLNAFQEQGRE